MVVRGLAATSLLTYPQRDPGKGAKVVESEKENVDMAGGVMVVVNCGSVKCSDGEGAS